MKHKSSQNDFAKRLRNLDIGKCYITKDITTIGEGHVIVSRIHKGGNITIAFFLLDIQCMGVKDTFFKKRITSVEFDSIIHSIGDTLIECKYEEAHNWILGAIEFAEEAGIKPHPDFKETQYILEEDSDDIPLIEYEYGHNGKHHFVAMSETEWIRTKPILDKNLGEGNYTYIAPANFYEEDEDFSAYNHYITDDNMPYTYQHPDYPSRLQLHHPWLHDELYQSKYGFGLPDEVTDRILALPHDELRQDLEQIILYHTGLTCDGKTEDYDPEGFSGIISNAIILLGEVGNSDSSLNAVLETLRQNEDFCDYHFGDFTDDVIIATLYKLAGNHLGKLLDFYKEEGLYEYAKSHIPTVITLVYYLPPERKSEAVEWYSDALKFAAAHVHEKKAINSTMTSLLLGDVMDIKEKELIPLVEDVFETNLVSTSACGTSEDVISEISNPHHHLFRPNNYPLEIHEHFKYNIDRLSRVTYYNRNSENI